MTLVVTVAALLLQLGLVVQGQSVLDESRTPPLATRLWRLVSYFTILSNILVAAVTATLIRDADRDGRVWRVLRLDAVLGITLTGLVHFFLLRPLLDLQGLNAVADAGLHVVVPALALIGWLLFGPRPRVTLGVVMWSLLWPIAWLGYTLVVGAVTQWYPYPFLDVSVRGGSAVFTTCLAVTVLFITLAGAAWLADAKLPGAPRTAGSSIRG